MSRQYVFKHVAVIMQLTKGWIIYKSTAEIFQILIRSFSKLYKTMDTKTAKIFSEFTFRNEKFMFVEKL